MIDLGHQDTIYSEHHAQLSATRAAERTASVCTNGSVCFPLSDARSTLPAPAVRVNRTADGIWFARKPPLHPLDKPPVKPLVTRDGPRPSQGEQPLKTPSSPHLFTTRYALFFFSFRTSTQTQLYKTLLGRSHTPTHSRSGNPGHPRNARLRSLFDLRRYNLNCTLASDTPLFPETDLIPH